jgi:hypothetical protein
MSQNALRWLTTFSRDVNAPSWAPTHDASEWFGGLAKNGPATGGSNSAQSSLGPFITTGQPLPASYAPYAYKTNADDPNAFNRRMGNVRVQRVFTRRDGSRARVGEPLLATRFDLQKIALLSRADAASSPEIQVQIESHFGLRKNADGAWVYGHDTDGRIRTLEEVAQEGREPDFFELLSAGILLGSLGLNSGDPGQPGAPSSVANFTAFCTKQMRPARRLQPPPMWPCCAATAIPACPFMRRKNTN